MAKPRPSLRSDHCPSSIGIGVRQLSESVSAFAGIRTEGHRADNDFPGWLDWWTGGVSFQSYDTVFGPWSVVCGPWSLLSPLPFALSSSPSASALLSVKSVKSVVKLSSRSHENENFFGS